MPWRRKARCRSLLVLLIAIRNTVVLIIVMCCRHIVVKADWLERVLVNHRTGQGRGGARRCGRVNAGPADAFVNGPVMAIGRLAVTVELRHLLSGGVHSERPAERVTHENEGQWAGIVENGTGNNRDNSEER
jgi:hypothetical protein